MSDDKAPTNISGTFQPESQIRIAMDLAKYQDRAPQGKLRYIHGVGWHYWTGSHWRFDDHGAARRRVLHVTKNLYRISMGDLRAARDARACSNNAGQEGILNIARNMEEFSTEPSQMDADPYLLNLQNGTYNLLTHQLQPHDPDDLITKIAGAAYDPDADTTEWDAYLARVLPDEEVRSYLQRFMGLSLIGEVIENIFGIAIGGGANGKSTFVDAFDVALGTYHRAAESDLFMTIKDNANAASPAVLALMGARFVVCSETEEGRPLAAALMKNLTGGDQVTARGVYSKQAVTFRPVMTPLLVTNHLPKVKGNDEALFRRISVIPFTVTLPLEERDPEVKTRLKSNPNVPLLWAIEGLKQYQAIKLQPPAAVKMATDRYQSDSDAMKRFIKAYLVDSPGNRINRTEVWLTWKRWSSEESLPAGGMSDFYTELEKHYRKLTVQGVRMFEGFTLRAEARPEDEPILRLIQEERNEGEQSSS